MVSKMKPNFYIFHICPKLSIFIQIELTCADVTFYFEVGEVGDCVDYFDTSDLFKTTYYVSVIRKFYPILFIKLACNCYNNTLVN